MNSTFKMDFLSRLVGVMMNGFSTSKKKHKIVLQASFAIEASNVTMNIDVEDGGQAIIATTSLDAKGNPDGRGAGVYARITSWDEKKKHTEMKKLLGRKIKVTIETID